MVEKSGIDLDQFLKLLVKNAAAELTTFYYCTILRVNLIGLEGEGLKEIAEVPGSRTGITSRRWSPGFTNSAESFRKA